MKESLTQPQVIAIVWAVAMVIVGIWLLQRQRRRRDLAMAGHWLGLVFSFRTDQELTAAIRSMQLFAFSRSERAYNVLKGIFQGVDWRISDYYYVTGAGKNSQGHGQTMALCRTESPLPDFTVSAERFYHRLAAMLGHRDINFPAFPSFSRRYLLRAGDEAALRRLFTPDIIRFFEQRNRTIHVAARSGWVAIYYPGRHVSGQEMRSFLEMTAELVQRLVKAQQAVQKEGRW